MVSSLEGQLSRLTTIALTKKEQKQGVGLVKIEEDLLADKQKMNMDQVLIEEVSAEEEETEELTPKLSKDLQQYLDYHTNMWTAETLIGEPNQVFYRWEEEKKRGFLTCPCCSDTATVEDCPSRKFSLRKAAKMMLSHYTMYHPSTLEYNFSHHVTMSAVKQVTLKDILRELHNPKISKLIVVDRSYPFYYEHWPSQEEQSYAVEVLYYGEKPHSRCPYLRGNNAREIQFLLGMLIGWGVKLGKAIQVHTQGKRKDEIDKLAAYYDLARVTAVEGQGRKETRMRRPTLISKQTSEQ